jgi:hypothetical protein
MSTDDVPIQTEVDELQLASNGADENLQRPRMTTVWLPGVHDGIRIASLAGRYRDGPGTADGPQVPGKPHRKANLNLSPR